MAALVEVAVLERRAPAGKTCAAVHFGTAQAATVAIARRAPDRLEASLHDGLCGLEFSLTPRLPELYAAAFVELSSGRFIEAGGKPGALDGRSPLPPRLSWSVDVPRRMSEPIVYRLVVVAAAHPVADAAARLREGAQPQAAEAASGGATVISLAHRVVP